MIDDINFNQVNFFEKDIFKRILDEEDNYIGIVIRDFFNTEELELLKDTFVPLESKMFSPFESYKALPRPFDHVNFESPNDYHQEVKSLNNLEAIKTVEEKFFSKLKKYNSNFETSLAAIPNNLSLSKSWFSYRKLLPNKGAFDLHCGYLFLKWNEEFFKLQGNTCDTNNHLAFLMMVQKPDSVSDIDIYNAHRKNFVDKRDPNILVNKEGEEVALEDIECFNIKLNSGDLLIFDECNYWHAVAPFKGNTDRISFGGFISKFKEQNKMLFWA